MANENKGGNAFRKGVCTFYNPRSFGDHRGQGKLHRSDVGCPLDAEDCRQDDHFALFSVYDVQRLGEIPEPGDELEFVPIQYVKGHSSYADKLRFPRQTGGRKSSDEELRARYGR